MKLPAYGKALLDARRLGGRPADPVIVTDCWGVAKVYQEADKFALVCAPAWTPYDFTLLYNLDVMLLVGSDDALGIAERIARAKPERLSVLLREQVMQSMLRLRERLEDLGRGRSVERALRDLADFELGVV